MKQPTGLDLKHSKSMAEDKKQHFSGDTDTKLTNDTLESLLVKKARQGVDIKIIVSGQRFC